MKRSFDLIGSAVGLFLLSPLLTTIACVLLLTSGRPVLFRHTRIGQFGSEFEVLKFRTMTSGVVGPSVTSSDDSRITPVGKFLRNSKLDELPQLINVLRGEMSFVGPRPEVAKYVRLYPDEFTDLHLVRPGITDPCTLEFRNEQGLLASQSDPEEFYMAVLLPKKISLSQAYIAEQSFMGDIRIIADTIKAVVR